MAKALSVHIEDDTTLMAKGLLHGRRTMISYDVVW